MVDLSHYKLTEIPFLAIPAIRIDSSDRRANGRLFCREVAEEQLQRAEQLILSENFPIIFLRTEEAVLGNGKSAFMAATYWDAFDKGKNLLWAEATTNPNMRDLLSKILDSFVKEKKLKLLREKLQPISPRRIENIIHSKTSRIGPSTLYAINQLLMAEEHELTYVYSNIKRRIPVQGHVELFGAFLDLFYSLDLPRFTVFIDQFEEYVRSHHSMSQQRKLSEELNDLQRAIGETTTLVVTLHPMAEGILRTSAPEFETFTDIGLCSVDLPTYTEEDLLKMVKFYLKTFRTKGYNGDPLFPFEESLVRYSIHRTSMVPRTLIISLRQGLIYGSLGKYDHIGEQFILKNHKNMFGSLDNKWLDFKAGKF